MNIHEQSRLAAGRVQRILVSDATSIPGKTPNQHAQAPDVTTQPDVVTSPLRADAQAPASGLMLLLTAPSGSGTGPPAAAATAAGFKVTVWVRDSLTRQWGATTQFQAPYGVWMRTFDFNGGELYFQFDVTSISGGGTGIFKGIDVHFVEL